MRSNRYQKFDAEWRKKYYLTQTDKGSWFRQSSLLELYQQPLSFAVACFKPLLLLLFFDKKRVPYNQRDTSVFSVLTSLDMWSPKGVNGLEKFGIDKKNLSMFLRERAFFERVNRVCKPYGLQWNTNPKTLVRNTVYQNGSPAKASYDSCVSVKR